MSAATKHRIFFSRGSIFSFGLVVLLIMGAEGFSFPKVKSKGQKTGPAKKTLLSEEKKNQPDTLPWMYAQDSGFSCYEFAETAVQCFRKEKGLFPIELGLPGTGAKLWSSYNWSEISRDNRSVNSLESNPSDWGGLLPDLNLPTKYSNARFYHWDNPVLQASPLDTPFTQIQWERGALKLNVFQLDFRRNLSASVFARLKMASFSASQVDYDYAPQAHQLSLSGFGLGKLLGIDVMVRDSSDLVITGKSLASEVFSINPIIGIQLGKNQALEFSFSHFDDESETPSAYYELEDRGFYHEKIQQPLPRSFSQQTLAADYLGGWAGFKLHLKTRQSWWENEEPGSSAKPEDSLYFSLNNSGQAQKLDLSLRRKIGILESEIYGNLSNRIVEAPLFYADINTWDSVGYSPYLKSGYEDRESLGARAGVQYSFLEANVSLAGERFSNMENQRDLFPSYDVFLGLKLPLKFRLKTFSSLEPQWPYWKTQYLPNANYFRLAHNNLKAQQFYNQGVHLDWNSRYVSLGLNYHYHYINQPLLPQLLPDREVTRNISWDNLALVNWEYQKRHSLGYWTELKAGNWKTALEHRFLLENQLKHSDTVSLFSKNLMEPAYVVKGSLEWENKFVFKRLRVNTQWNWEYWPLRYGWAIPEAGIARLERLNPYLALDFLAMMQIRSFKLVAQIKNLYHQRYAIRPGSHPEGINMRWGVHWTFKN